MRRALSLSGLLLTLAGLFAMHGLAEHGTGAGSDAHGSMPTMASSGLSAAGHTTTHGANQTAQAVVALPAMASRALDTAALHGPSGGTGMDMSAIGMCLAVLLLTVIALILQLHANRPRPVLFLTARPARAPVAPSREADPPNLFALSIQRC